MNNLMVHLKRIVMVIALFLVQSQAFSTPLIRPVQSLAFSTPLLLPVQTQAFSTPLLLPVLSFAFVRPLNIINH